MKVIYLIVFILCFYLTNLLILEERQYKKIILEKFVGNVDNDLYLIDKKYNNNCLIDNSIDYFRCRFIKDYNNLIYDNKNITRIAFGSCNSQYENQEFWQKIQDFNPKLWIWLGDNIYADYYPKDMVKNSNHIEHMENQYLKLVNNKYYTKFLNSGIEITGIWDDHDYYSNNSGSEVSKNNKLKSKQLFFDFININKTDENLEKSADPDGIYRSYFIGSDIQILLLDTRTFKSKNDILGIKQWNWLKKELINSNAKLNLIISGTQVISDRQHDDESWSSIGNCRIKLMQLLNCLNKKNTLIISGDIHKSCVKSNYGFFEITASPLSNFISKHKYNHKNNIGEYIEKHNYGFLDIHWDKNNEIKKIITGFNDTIDNKSYNILEIR